MMPHESLPERRLCDLEPGASGRVTAIRTREPRRLDQLAALGLTAGSELRLRRRRPAVIVEVGETTLALDARLARDILVQPER